MAARRTSLVEAMEAARALREGAAGALSDRALLAVLGARGVAERLEGLAAASVDALERHGFSPRAAERVAAAFELGRRAGWRRPERGASCVSAEAVQALMRDVAHLEVETFWVVLLDVRGRLLRRVRVAQGSVAACPVPMVDVLRPVIEAGAHSFVAVHNHPSFCPAPSPDDRALTERLRAAAELVGVKMRDHVIVGGDARFSFVEAGAW